MNPLKIHYTESGNASVCGSYDKSCFGDTHKIPHLTDDATKVTCKRCKIYLRKQNYMYKCPICGKYTDTLKLTEAIIQESSIFIGSKFERINIKTAQRDLIRVNCPACFCEIPLNGRSWCEIRDTLIT